MKNLILVTITLCLCAFSTNAQITVKAPNGDVGVGTDTPNTKLDVDGVIRVDPGTTANNYGEIINSTANLNIDKVRPAGNALIDINPKPMDGSSNAKFRFFRQTNTSGNTELDVHHGDGTSAVNSRLSGNGNSFLNKDFGNVAIGVAVGAGEKLYVSGDIFATGTITPSDKRLKNKVKSFDDGLEVILNLNPVSYNYNGKASLDTKRQHIGVIAQELQEEAPYLVENFEYIVTDDEARQIGTESYLKIHDSEIKYLLINAIQEQQVIIETQKEELAAVKNELEEIKKLILRNTDSNNVSAEELPSDNVKNKVWQNTPNPFSNETIINYAIKNNFSKATLEIYSANGALIESKEIRNNEGQININSKLMASGIYNYSLIVDGKIIDTKKMVVSK